MQVNENLQCVYIKIAGNKTEKPGENKNCSFFKVTYILYNST